MRSLASALIVGIACGTTHAAWAGEPTECIAAHVAAQRAMRDSKLGTAREELVKCGNPSCPSVVMKECVSLLAEVQGRIPTVTFSATDGDGRDIADAKVLEGDHEIIAKLDGKEVEVDPGEHRFRFERADGKSAEVVLVIREGDKLRRVSVQFDPPKPKTTAPPASGEEARDVTPAFWVVGTIGLVGVATFGALATAGYLKKNDLDDAHCAPNCPSSDVDTIRALFLAGDIALGVGVAGLVVAPILYFTSPVETTAPAVDGALLQWGTTF